MSAAESDRELLERAAKAIGYATTITFNPAVQYGNFAFVDSDWSDTLVQEAKESLRAGMEGFIPPGFRKRVIWICIPPGVPGMPGTVAWKYNPPRAPKS